MRGQHSRFAPIAIVARACVLPGALSPEALWAAIRDHRDLTTDASMARWRMPADAALATPGAIDPDRATHARVGAVSGFEAIFDAASFGSDVAGLDPLVHWLLHTGRLCLQGTTGARDRRRTGAVIGNLGFPSEAMARYADGVWRGAPADDPRHRFMSGGTAAIVAEKLELGLGAFCLDAACASSLYAIEAACRTLADGRADLMLAGAVQRADDLFLHVGFSALTALGRSAQSRPFHREADGLVPAEGAVLFAMKRLADARRDGDTIHGVIRGIGLANDGRGRGLLVPDAGGQERCLRLAYAMSGIDPADVGLLECHATGTTVGDATEIRSAAAVFAGRTGMPIGSLKSNMGHPITAAGGAGLLKVLAAIEHGVLPPTRIEGDENPALVDSPFRVLREAMPWSIPKSDRIAAVSAFGFGGNNAHLIVSADEDSIADVAASNRFVPLAIVGIGMQVGSAADRAAIESHLCAGSAPAHPVIDRVAVELDGLRTPPKDLARCLPQQLVLFETTRHAMSRVSAVDGTRMGVFVGMEPDPNVARFGARWRLANELDVAALSGARDDVVAALDAAAVLGTMPNIPANRISAQHDFGATSLTVQARAASGLAALDLAVNGLVRGELDAALVSAVDFCADPVAQAAAPDERTDAAVTWVVKRLDDATRDGDPVLAVINETITDATPPDAFDAWGKPGAASALQSITLSLLARHRELDVRGQPQITSQPPIRLNLPLGRILALHAPPSDRRLIEADVPAMIHYAAANRADLLAAIKTRRTGLDGAARLVMLARAGDIEAQHDRAIALLEQGVPTGPSIQFRETPIQGETAFVFAGAGAAYADMGRALLADLPMLKDTLRTDAPKLLEGLRAAWSVSFTDADPSAQLVAASALSQMHVTVSERLLGLKADAWLGYSSGETNALFASGVWRDPDGLMADMDASGLMTRSLSGSFDTLKSLWPDFDGFATWTILAPLDEVRLAMTGQDRVRLLIIDSEEQCLIAGDRRDCDVVIERIGRTRCLPLTYSLVVHMPEVLAVADAWRRLHHRRTHPIRSGRLYGTAAAEAYAPSDAACAEAILDQATDTLDMRPVIEQAWQDGVRVFVEHGPGASFARAIRNQLGDREALIVSLDRKGLGVEGVMQVAATLWAAGVSVDLDGLLARCRVTPAPSPPKRPLWLPGHWPPVRLPSGTTSIGDLIMKPAPKLPSVWFRPHRSLRAAATVLRTDGAVAPNMVAVTPKPDIARVASALREPVSASAASAKTVSSPGPASSIDVSAVTQQLRALADMHQHYLALQGNAHRHFLDVREKAMASLLGATVPASATPQAPSREPTPTAPKTEPPAVHVAVSKPAPMVVSTIKPAAEPIVHRHTQRTPIGPQWSRQQLEVHADGAISRIYGPAFSGQDRFERQVRMPKPPLLLADRVVGIDAEPMGMGKGTIWTETDVGAQPWYLHHDHMPAGVMIEAGQADLMLISWVGIDQFNRSERVYRLLGCELTYHGDLPKRGETLRFQIDLDGHAAQGDVRLMFFHYDCMNGDRPQLSVRQGQAGFFTDQELADSAGCLWSPESQDIVANARVDAPRVPITKSRFSRADLDAFAAGDLVACFGDGHRFTRTHTRTPTIAGGNMLLFDRITDLQHDGGPWQRGYLRAELDIDPAQWFFDGHFKNDPCMPGTLMFEACLAAMAFYQAAVGDTLRRDGWRFQPVPEIPYKLQCRGQVTPTSKRLVTEIFVEERHDGPIPTLYADLLCTVDGLKAFHARRVGVQLVPDWPMAHAADIPVDELTRPVATIDGFRFDRRALLACADGRPSEAFGPMYRRFDGVQRVARLPSPPYHFITRIAELDGPIGVMKAGARVVAEYEIPDQEWYFDDNGNQAMPFAVLLEAALQPCGWLSSYVGSALTQDIELGFRNLDGDGTIFGEIRPGDGTLRTEVKLTDVSASGGMIIESFEVDCRIGDRPIYRLKTVFGFFPEAALANQAGLPVNVAHADMRVAPAMNLPAPADDSPKQAHGMLRMIDQVDAYWPDGGRAGLGAARAFKRIDTNEWFFKAHFFQDPVQPGSLGLEAMVHTLADLMLRLGMADGMSAPRFQTIATNFPHRWKYRGQVLPKHDLVQTTLEIIERGVDDQGVYALAEASLWVDGQRIYEATGLGLRILDSAR